MCTWHKGLHNINLLYHSQKKFRKIEIYQNPNFNLAYSVSFRLAEEWLIIHRRCPMCISTVEMYIRGPQHTVLKFRGRRNEANYPAIYHPQRALPALFSPIASSLSAPLSSLLINSIAPPWNRRASIKYMLFTHKASANSTTRPPPYPRWESLTDCRTHDMPLPP